MLKEQKAQRALGNRAASQESWDSVKLAGTRRIHIGHDLLVSAVTRDYRDSRR
ncbi:hypothetical protein ACX12E_29160 [Paenibacillus vandeheii]